MIEQVILGIIQGIAEWLPVSSEGLIVLVKNNFFESGGIENIIRQALFLHLGTFLAALLYFRKEVLSLTKDKELLKFLIIATLISGIFGYGLIKVFLNLENELSLSTKAITLIIGLFLLLTALFQLKAKMGEYKERKDLNTKDGILLGLVQAIAVLPGLSRSGLTVSTLLLRKFKSREALTLSFLMSLPIVLGGNIILNFNQFSFNSGNLLGLFFSFIFGLLTIGLLLKIAGRINFGYFVLIFGLLVIISVFV